MPAAQHDVWPAGDESGHNFSGFLRGDSTVAENGNAPLCRPQVGKLRPFTNKIGQRPATLVAGSRRIEVDDEGTPHRRRKGERGDRPKDTVGFALTILQRRLASSPEAIFQSL